MTLDFKKLTINDIGIYYLFANRFKSYSDLNFSSLISWCENVNYYIDNDCLIVYFDDYSSNKTIISGISDCPTLLIDKLIFCNKELQNSTIDTVPSFVIENLENEKLRKSFKYSDEQADYIYKPSTQIEQKGSRFSWHRRKLSYFIRTYPVPNIGISSLLSSEERHLFPNVWMEWKDPSNIKESAAINRYVKFFDNLINQIVFKVHISNELVGYAFCETVNGPTKDLLIHFFKTNKKYQGLSNYLFLEISKYAKKHGIDHINFEQDLEETGLRYYKQHLRPDFMLQKMHYLGNSN